MAINGAGTEGVDRFVRSILGGTGIRARSAALGRQDALREALTGSQVDNTRAEAALRQNKLTNLDPAVLGPAIAGALGIPDAQGGNLATVGGAGLGNVSEMAQALRTAQMVSAQRAARNSALSGNMNEANANLFGVANGPQKLSAVEGGVTLNPLATPDQNDFTPTDVGQAMIGADNARAAASYASAARQKAGIAADRAGNYETIDTGEGGLVRHNKLTNVVDSILGADNQPVRKAAKAEATLLPEHVADAVLGKVTDAMGNATPDPEAYGQFQAWQAEKAKTDPRYSNAAFAVQRYQTEAPVGSRMAITSPDAKGVNHLGIGNVSAPGAMDLQGNPLPALVAAITGGNAQRGNAGNAIQDNALTGSGSSPAKQGGDGDPSSLVRQAVAPDATTGTAPTGEAATLGILNGGAAPAAAGQVATPQSEAEYNALPAGTLYQHPDGTIKRKGG